MAERNFAGALVLAVVSCLLFVPRLAGAHCDTLDGPVVKEARAALEKGDVTPVLKWVKKEHEAEVKDAFKKTLVVRSKGPEARDLSDMYFLETIVRLHRAGEGEPYTGLKPAGAGLGPAVVESDKALDTGDVDAVIRAVTGPAAAGIRERFARALGAKKHAAESVEAGREFVESYVEYVHYVERLYVDSEGGGAHGHASEAHTE